MSENESKNKFEALSAGMSVTQHAALVILLSRLQDDISRNDSASALRTIDHIRAAAGHDYAMQLMDTLIAAGIRRLAEKAVPNK